MLAAMAVGPSCFMLQKPVSGSARVPEMGGGGGGLKKIFFGPLGRGGGGGGGGGAGVQRNFKWGSSAPMSDPLPCYKPFLTGKVPIWYTFH